MNTPTPGLSDISLSNENGTWCFRGHITQNNANTAFLLSANSLLPESGVVDFSGVSKADSTALSLMLAITRRANRQAAKLAFRGVSDNLKTLARVYGIEHLFLRSLK
ncbi:MAG: STAS domain-containing protein [Burkholderiales bacterium]|jgi:ABC-type transporter Mla MlaB component|nr:STAS domain-containing protein [Burkholderiales bacterium]